MDCVEIKRGRIKKKTIKIVKTTINAIFFVVVGFFLLFFVLNLFDINSGYNFPFFGLRASVIVSESMQYPNPENTYLTDDMNRINKNDVIITYNCESYESIHLYDVITHYTPNGLICHRVVKLYSENGKQLIVTRGDSNNTDDAPFEFSAVRGRVINVIPGAGTFIKFIQSPYLAIALFGSLFFVFLSAFIMSVGDYGKYNKLLKEKPTYEDDKVQIINSSVYDECKKKKNFVLVGVDNHYEISRKKGTLILIRYIRTDYENKIDKTIVSGVYDKKELNETIILSILSYAFDTVIYGFNPLNDIKKFLIEKKIINKKSNDLSVATKLVINSIPNDMKEDVDNLNEEQKEKYKYLLISYNKCSKYIAKKFNNLDDCKTLYSYLIYCFNHDINPLDIFEEKGLSFDA